jgi:hypothetical protein
VGAPCGSDGGRARGSALRGLGGKGRPACCVSEGKGAAWELPAAVTTLGRRPREDWEGKGRRPACVLS